MIVAVVACVPALAMLLAILLLGYRRGELTAVATAATARGREEDRVRPVVDASGAKVWVDADDIVWHVIVSWPIPGRSAKQPESPVRLSG